MTYTEDIISTLTLMGQDEKFWYVRFEPLIVDFTKPFKGRMVCCTPSKELKVEFSDLYEKNGIKSILSLIFAKGNTVLSWDIKYFASYLKKRFPTCNIPFNCRLIDIKYGLSFYGIRNQSEPKSFCEAIKFAKVFVNDVNWQKISKQIFNPLATDVLPAIETKGVVNTTTSQAMYSSYEIDAQVNGRLSTHKVSDHYITPHSLTPELRNIIAPRCEDYESDLFAYFDYNNMEVAVLQWLTKDPELGKLLSCGRDFYTVLYEFMFKTECDSAKRELAKGFFLPIMYGLQANNLSKKLKVSLSDAEDIISKQNQTFKIATGWLLEKQLETLENSIGIDRFGRKRDFKNMPAYLRRNFEVQSPGSLVCLDKLCCLGKKFKSNLALCIHDGYILTIPSKSVSEYIVEIKEVLQSPSALAEGLKLNVSCKLGSRLGNLNKIKESELWSK